MGNESPVDRLLDDEASEAKTDWEIPKNIAVIGGGIIGCATAYYITRHPSYDPSKTKIHLLEASSIAAGASGHAGGLLALDWHSESTASLAELSYKLHSQLASEHDGANTWGYRPLTTLDVKFKYGDTFLKLKKSKSEVPEWIDSEIVSTSSKLGSEETTSQVHPRLFTKKICELAVEKGLKVVYGTATKILTDETRVTGLAYTPQKPNGEVALDPSSPIEGNPNELDDGEEKLDAECIIVAAGPWTSRVLPEIPITTQRAHSITIQTAESLTPHALFTTLKSNKGLIMSPEIYCRPDEVYVCGEADSIEALPTLALQVKVDKQSCDDLKDAVGEISAALKDGTVKDRQACYLPYCGPTGPVIGWVPDMEGVLVAAGHSCWGICNGPGTGKVVSEMVMEGQASSADIIMLDPARFF